MAHPNGSPDTLEKHQYEVCNAFARAAVAMRDAAQTAENFSNWFSRVNNLQNVAVPPMFNGPYNFMQNHGGPQQQPYQGSETEQSGKKRKASGEQGGKRKREVKEKKPKDLNAPKRPPSAYLLFQNEVRGSVKGEHPDMPYSQILSEISKLWHALTTEEKAPYMQATADSKALYEKAKADYDAHSPTETAAAKDPTDKEATSKAKSPAVLAANKSTTKVATTSGDDNDDDESPSSSSSSSSPDEEEEVEEAEKAPQPVPEPAPQPPRKKAKKEAEKSKKETVKAPAPPPSKAEKKKKPEEGKKKKKTDAT